jgi:hypothetical protein
MTKKLMLLGLCVMGAFSAVQADEPAPVAAETKPVAAETSDTTAAAEKEVPASAAAATSAQS